MGQGVEISDGRKVQRNNRPQSLVSHQHRDYFSHCFVYLTVLQSYSKPYTGSNPLRMEQPHIGLGKQEQFHTVVEPDSTNSPYRYVVMDKLDSRSKFKIRASRYDH